MDIKTLTTFIQVAELGSFTRAGETLGYSQPTISFQIRQLENELDTRLFDRIGHTVRLTGKGREVLLYAQHIVHTYEEMIRGDLTSDTVPAVIRLAMADSLCSPLIGERFAAFRAQFPHISLHVTSGGTDAMFRLLDHNEVDLVCTLDSHIYNTNYMIAAEEKIGVHFVAAAGHPLACKGPLSIMELLPYPFLLTEKGMSYRRLLDEHLARFSQELHPILENGSTELLCSLAERGAGIAFLPDYVTRSAIVRGTLVQLDVADFVPELWKQLIYHRDKWVSPQMQAVISHLSDILLNK